MFNDDAFGKIKKGARIVNVARGGVIDDAALGRALDAGQVAQVGTYSLRIFKPIHWAGCLPWPTQGSRQQLLWANMGQLPAAAVAKLCCWQGCPQQAGL